MYKGLKIQTMKAALPASRSQAGCRNQAGMNVYQFDI
jgi:hypothetical protein